MNRDFADLGGRDPHQVLGVPDGATREEIVRQHRRLLRTTHPDVGGDHNAQARLNLARDILLDPRRRRGYEEALRRRDAEEIEEVPDDPPVYEDPFRWESGIGPSTGGAEPPRFRPPVSKPPPYVPPPPVFVPYPYGPQGYGGYPPLVVIQRRGWNTLSVVAISISLCCTPAGLVLGIIALTQIRDTEERGTALAWFAIVISAMGLVLNLFVILLPFANFSHPPPPTSSSVPVPSGS